MSLPSLIVLCGFMGTGKSAVGRALSKMIRYQFFDSDRELEAKEGRSIPQIFEQEGEAYFRALEKETIFKLAQSENTILSIGGGALLNPEVFQLLASKGKMILLEATADEIAKRLGHENERPLLKGGNRKKKILELMKQREPIYAQIQLKLDTTGLAVDEVVQRVYSLLEDSL